MDELTAAGLGLDYGSVRLERTTEDWIAAGSTLRHRVATVLVASVDDVEQVGSSSVVGLLAKPIIDLVVGLRASQELTTILEPLETEGWWYRGDAGADGGHVFVLESRPWHRVAHLHGVTHGGTQWVNYLRFRDLLRQSATARTDYEAVKVDLAARNPDDRPAYTAGKSDVVQRLLDGIRP